VNHEVYAEAMRENKALPSLHSSRWAPDAEPAIKTGVIAEIAAALELMKP